MGQEFLTVKENATGTTIRIPISAHNTIPASALAPLKITQTTPLHIVSLDPNAARETVQTPLRVYDPGFENTVVCKSRISLLENSEGGQSGLRYRGYLVSDLVEKSSFLDVAYLLINGELPSKIESENWTKLVLSHTYVHSELEKQVATFRYDAHPMGMLIATVASMSTFHPDANPALQGDSMYMKPKSLETSADIKQNAKALLNRNKAISRMLGKIPTIASFAYRNRIGRSFNTPMPNVTNYAENFLYMIDKLNEPNYIPNPRIVSILDKMFILLAENSSSNSTITIRHLASSGVDPYTALSGSFGALFGERKCSAVMNMLIQIETVENIPKFLQLFKDGRPISKKDGMLIVDPNGGKPTHLQGFGFFKGPSPRAELSKGLVLQLFELIGKGDMGEIALALEMASLEDEWCQSQGLFPNIDYWTAIFFHTLGFPPDMFPVLAAIPRTAGLVAHWQESLDDPEYKIYRPRQIYIGEVLRDYVLDRKLIDADEAPQPANDSGHDYAKSLPEQANKRLSLQPNAGIDESKLADFRSMIDRTRSTIEELSELTGHASKSGYQPITKLGSWVLGKPTASEARRNSSERLEKTQRELQELLQQQQQLLELYIGVRDREREKAEAAVAVVTTATADACGSGFSSPTFGNVVMPIPRRSLSQTPSADRSSREGVPLGKSPSLGHGLNASGGAPDLLAGSHSPRPILKKSEQQ